jgi:DNA repair photolyase
MNIRPQLRWACGIDFSASCNYKIRLVIRDFDLLKEINRRAILPADLEGKLSQKVFITFSFSTIDNSVAKVFEPGATPPDKKIADT